MEYKSNRNVVYSCKYHVATRERRTEGMHAARTPQEAAARLRAAGFKVIEPKRRGVFEPIDVPGLDLSKALEEVRGKRSR